MTARTDRIDQLLRQEIGAILAKDVQDPRIGFVTVTDVETAPDLSAARVWVSVIGQPAERELTMRALQHALPFVRHELGARIRLRRIPELQLRARRHRSSAARACSSSSRSSRPAATSRTIRRSRSRCRPPWARSRFRRHRAARSGQGKRQRRERRPARSTAGDERRPPTVAGRGARRGGERHRAARATPSIATHENPDADTLGAALGVATIVEHHGGRATLVSTDPVPPLYDFLPGMDRFVQDPAAGRRLRPARRLRLRLARPPGRGPRAPSRAVRAAAARAHRPPRLEHRRRSERLGGPGRGRDVRAGRAARGEARRAARRRRRRDWPRR